MCVFTFFLSPLTNKTKVELSNGNWKEIERVEVNLENNEPQNLVEEVDEFKDAVERKNGNVINEIEERVNGDSKGLKEQVEDLKVWLILLLIILSNNIACYHCLKKIWIQ